MNRQIKYKFVRTSDGSIIISFNEYENRHEIAEQIEREILDNQQIRKWLEQYDIKSIHDEKIQWKKAEQSYIKFNKDKYDEIKKLEDEVKRLRELLDKTVKFYDKKIDEIYIQKQDLKEKIEKITKITSEITYEDSDYKDYYHGINKIKEVIGETNHG